MGSSARSPAEMGPGLKKLAHGTTGFQAFLPGQDRLGPRFYASGFSRPGLTDAQVSGLV
jgi:hypothetical protein